MSTCSELSEAQARLAQEHEAAAARARAAAARYAKGERGEAVVRALLEDLVAEGWTVLHDRRWPGRRRANLDHVLIGPGGVLVLDTKHWRGELFVHGGRLWRAQEDASDAVQGVLDQVVDVEEALAPCGLPPLEVSGALVFVGTTMAPHVMGRVQLLDEERLVQCVRARGQRLSREQVVDLAAVVETALPPATGPSRPLIPFVRSRVRPRTPAGQESLFSAETLDLEELERAARLPLESWMTYLHPSQLDLVRRRHRGPSRIRGPAGCGKTVVALHRAAYLAAQEPGDLLVLSYVKTLPAVLSSLYGRLSPQTADRVHFSGVHKLAYDIVAEAGQHVVVDPAAADTCFNLAWARHGRSQLDHLPRSYWQEEVRAVIKGRGITDFDDYRGLARTGRRTPLSPDQRARVWDMYVDYEQRLTARGLSDFVDLVALALRAVHAGAGPRYRFVIVDEAQDLDLLSVRLAAALVREDADGLTLVGDGQQSIYPGGYTLKEAGLQVAGRASVLTTNYRNTRQIVAAARALVAKDVFHDLEGDGEAGDRAIDAVRDGAAVLTITGDDPASLDVALSQRLRHDRAVGLQAADAAVLCRNGKDAERLRVYLRRDGHPVMDLQDYDGSPAPCIKVGTVKRAKGLEFGRVYLPRIDTYCCGDGEAEVERVERERRELFVAMTRARDGLWTSRLTSDA